MKWLNIVAKILASIGAINWGLVALNEDYNVVEMLVSGQAADIVYYLVGLSGLWLLVLVVKRLAK